MLFAITVNWGINLQADLSSLESVMETCFAEAPDQLWLVTDFTECLGPHQVWDFAVETKLHQERISRLQLCI